MLDYYEFFIFISIVLNYFLLKNILSNTLNMFRVRVKIRKLIDDKKIVQTLKNQKLQK
jgi:hypothetical protein